MGKGRNGRELEGTAEQKEKMQEATDSPAKFVNWMVNDINIMHSNDREKITLCHLSWCLKLCPRTPKLTEKTSFLKMNGQSLPVLGQTSLACATTKITSK